MDQDHPSLIPPDPLKPRKGKHLAPPRPNHLRVQYSRLFRFAAWVGLLLLFIMYLVA